MPCLSSWFPNYSHSNAVWRKQKWRGGRAGGIQDSGLKEPWSVRGVPKCFEIEIYDMSSHSMFSKYYLRNGSAIEVEPDRAMYLNYQTFIWLYTDFERVGGGMCSTAVLHDSPSVGTIREILVQRVRREGNRCPHFFHYSSLSLKNHQIDDYTQLTHDLEKKLTVSVKFLLANNFQRHKPGWSKIHGFTLT